MIEFPHNFFWGAATSAHQVEGNNTNNDWWEWEKRTGAKEPSGDACRHYDSYKQDFDLAKELGHNAHRLSVEWSRIEPSQGRFSQKEIDHYRDVVISLRERGLEPLVTLHHFTNPLWLAELGGWQDEKSPEYFSLYAEHIVEALGDKVNHWITINEPVVYVYLSYLKGIWPPQEKSFSKAKKVICNLSAAHIKTYQLIHKIYRKRNFAQPRISVAQSMQAFVACSPTLKNKISVYIKDRFFNFRFIDNLMRHKSLDFIGLNYYTRGLVDVEGWNFKNLLFDTCGKNHSQLRKNSLGWDIYPEGMYHLLLKIKKYNLPVFILENGICIEDDKMRWDFIRGHLKSVHLALGKGVDIAGYIYWSLMDNYEWGDGFSPRFGLIGIDYHTYKRTVRESARKFASVCRSGTLD